MKILSIFNADNVSGSFSMIGILLYVVKIASGIIYFINVISPDCMSYSRISTHDAFAVCAG